MEKSLGISKWTWVSKKMTSLSIRILMLPEVDLGEQSVASADADARRTATSEKSLGSQNGNRREITDEAKKVFRRLIGERRTV